MSNIDIFATGKKKKEKLNSQTTHNINNKKEKKIRS